MSRSTMQPQAERTTRRGRRGARAFIRRHPRASTATGVLAAGLVVFVLLWFEPQTALIDKRVDEARPAGIATGGAARAEVLGSGEFRGLEHETTGRAVLLDAPDGSRTLRLEDLDTLNGPDLRVYLSELPAGLGERAYGERFVDLGGLKGNRGSQNYQIPAEVDVARYRSVVIWCYRFTVGFGVAALER
jgi:hypothetical protein